MRDVFQLANDFITKRDVFAARNQEQRKAINGREWGVVRVGDVGPSLVLLPGTLGRGDIFWNQIEALNTRAQILTLSYPDSGNIETWAQDICLLMDDAGFETATILGSSLGGYLAQFFAAIFPKRTKSLIAANTLNTVDFLANVPPYSHDLNTVPASALRQGFIDNLSSVQEISSTKNQLIEFLLAEVSGRITQEELRTRLKVLKHAPEIPTQTLASDNIFTVESVDDQLIPPPLRDAVRARLQPARAYRFLQGGHFPYVLRPQNYTSLLEEVLGLEVTNQPWPQGALVEQ